MVELTYHKTKSRIRLYYNRRFLVLVNSNNASQEFRTQIQNLSIDDSFVKRKVKLCNLVLCEIKDKSQLSQRSPAEDDPPDPQQLRLDRMLESEGVIGSDAGQCPRHFPAFHFPNLFYRRQSGEPIGDVGRQHARTRRLPRQTETNPRHLPC